MGVLDQNFEFWSKFCRKLHLSEVPKSMSDFSASFVFFEKDLGQQKHPCTNSVFNSGAAVPLPQKNLRHAAAPQRFLAAALRHRSAASCGTLRQNQKILYKSAARCGKNGKFFRNLRFNCKLNVERFISERVLILPKYRDCIIEKITVDRF